MIEGGEILSFLKHSLDRELMGESEVLVVKARRQ